MGIVTIDFGDIIWNIPFKTLTDLEKFEEALFNGESVWIVANGEQKPMPEITRLPMREG